ncbi:147_t:CDS:2 [Scutellospora calospora]|uniref:147_t:CDS:1 n=1 Tax=Scutellospora calospora TaxID=85575 RepID=A0ACA9KAM4_9GLOM|nr:147_t:CDS:2 [Scutellospora calospora]
MTVDDIELKEGDFYNSHDAFVEAVKAYASKKGFQIRLGKVEKNIAGNIRKRTLLCSREGDPEKTSTGSNIRNRLSQRCNCQFLVRASFNSKNNLWYIIATYLEHNHAMVAVNHQHFISSEREIPSEIQEKILLLRRAGCNVATIHAILKEEFGSIVTWVYNDLYNFIYQHEGSNEKRNLDANNFVKLLEELNVCFAGALMHNESTDSFNWIFSNFLKLVNNNAPKVFLTDEDQAMIKAINQVFQPFGTKHALCLWHLFKNIIKNLHSKLGSKWARFIQQFYKCFDEYDEDNFKIQWEKLKSDFPESVNYLSKMDKNIQQWAPCFNRKFFMADMTTTQRGESMNNLMKGYMDATTSLTAFLKAFENALEHNKENVEFIKYQENNFNNYIITKSLFEKQASKLLTNYALKKTRIQLLESMAYKCEETIRFENEITFCLSRFQKQSHSPGRITTYNFINQQFTCSCNYTIFSGIICRHIFKVASQINLEELPNYLFLQRWRKDPNEHNLIILYKSFYNMSSNSIQPTTILNNSIEYDKNPKPAKKLTTKNKENLQLETSSSVKSHDLMDNSNIKSNEEQITS